MKANGHVGTCDLCGAKTRLLTAADPATGMIGYVCRHCEERWAGERGYAPLEQSDYEAMLAGRRACD